MDNKLSLGTLAFQSDSYEEWLVDINHSVIEGEDPQRVMDWASSPEGKTFWASQQSLDRVIACLEACADIPTAALEAGAIPRMREALEAMNDWWERDTFVTCRACGVNGVPHDADCPMDLVQEALRLVRGEGE